MSVDTEQDSREDNLRSVIGDLEERIAQLEDRWRTAVSEKEQAEQKLDRFQKRVQEVGERYAEEHDMCGVYDDAMHDLGLPGRPRPGTRQIRVSYLQNVDVLGRSDEERDALINDKQHRDWWTPPLPFNDSSGMEAAGYVTDITIEVIENEF